MSELSFLTALWLFGLDHSYKLKFVEPLTIVLPPTSDDASSTGFFYYCKDNTAEDSCHLVSVLTSRFLAHMTPSSIVSQLAYHLRTLWLFTVADLKTIFLPIVR